MDVDYNIASIGKNSKVKYSVFGVVRVCEEWQMKQERPYNHDSTASRLLSEVKHDLARLVLRWGTTLESLVLFFWLLKLPFGHAALLLSPHYIMLLSNHLTNSVVTDQ